MNKLNNTPTLKAPKNVRSHRATVYHLDGKLREALQRNPTLFPEKSVPHPSRFVPRFSQGKRRETRIVVVRKVVLEWSNLGTEKPKEPVAGHIGRGKEETEGNWPALSAHLTPSPARGG